MIEVTKERLIKYLEKNDREWDVHDGIN